MKKILLLSALAIFLNSCSDSRSEGCTDPYAVNYESFADYDDGSCVYIGCTDPLAINYDVLYTTFNPVCIYNSDVVFFEDVAAAVYFDNLGIQHLDISVQGVYVGTLQANLGFTYIPDCYPADPDAVNFTLQWEETTTTSQATFTWTVRDEFGQIHYSGTEAILANDCLAMELTWKKIQEYKEATK